MLEKVKVIMAAIATKMAVQMACVESALNAIEILSIAEAEMKVKTDRQTSAFDPPVLGKLDAPTQAERGAKEFTANTTKKHLPHVVDAVYMAVTDLEDANNVVRPRGDTTNHNQQNDTGDQPNGAENRRDPKYT